MSLSGPTALGVSGVNATLGNAAAYACDGWPKATRHNTSQASAKISFGCAYAYRGCPSSPVAIYLAWHHTEGKAGLL